MAFAYRPKARPSQGTSSGGDVSIVKDETGKVVIKDKTTGEQIEIT
jgi:hypothetical protein